MPTSVLTEQPSSDPFRVAVLNGIISFLKEAGYKPVMVAWVDSSPQGIVSGFNLGTNFIMMQDLGWRMDLAVEYGRMNVSITLFDKGPPLVRIPLDDPDCFQQLLGLLERKWKK